MRQPAEAFERQLDLPDAPCQRNVRRRRWPESDVGSQEAVSRQGAAQIAVEREARGEFLDQRSESVIRDRGRDERGEVVHVRRNLHPESQ